MKDEGKWNYMSRGKSIERRYILMKDNWDDYYEKGEKDTWLDDSEKEERD